jgi:spore germination cell wall hydrolase CwlJ-like protein
MNMQIDNESLQLNEPAFLMNERLFVPVRSIVENLGGTISWKPEVQQIYLSTLTNDTLIFTIGKSEMLFNDRLYIMDVEPFIIEERVYIPLRHAAEFLHTDVAWDSTTVTASFTRVPLYTILEGDSLASISEKFSVSESLLTERNSIINAQLFAGDSLKVSIPTIMENKLVAMELNPDYILLSKIIQVEAGYETYQSQLAVGSVIMNRVNDDRFPNTIKEVIYQHGQFPPAHNGLLDKSEPNDSVKLAAKAILNGENNVKGALYFYNPRVTKSEYWSSLTLIKEIGNHRYVK